MELIKILFEQSTDYSNWNTTKPTDFSTSKYDVKSQVVNGRVVISYKLKDSGGTSLSDYVGQYKVTTPAAVTVEIVNNGNKLTVKYGRVVEEEMTPSTNNDEFTFEFSGQHTITFKRDSNGKVNGFNGNVFSQNVVAEKVGSSSSAGTSGTAGSSGTTGSSGTAGSSGSAGSSGTPTVVQYTKYDAITPEDRIKGFQWKDCESKDFPYEFGCKNTKIGEMNECLFDTKLSGIFYRDLLEKLKDMAFDMSKKEITEDMYKAVMLDCKQQEESIERKKIIKENTYKILNQFK